MYSTRSTGSLELLNDELTAQVFTKLNIFENCHRNQHHHHSFFGHAAAIATKWLTVDKLKRTVFNMFPVIDVLKNYKLSDLPNDIIAGFTAGVMMIPQGMAYAALSTLPPIVGLYISFFSSVTYFFFGTGRQLSWGCIAILSLMIATILEKYDSSVAGQPEPTCLNSSVSLSYVHINSSNGQPASLSYIHSNSTNLQPGFLLEYVPPAMSVESNKMIDHTRRLEVASSVSVTAGIIFIVASRLGLSHVASIMSNSLITGFTVGVSFHVVTSQIKTMLGIVTPRYSGLGAILRTWVALLVQLPDTNVATLLISLVSLVIIYLVKTFINDKYKHRLRVPFPIELVVAVAATLMLSFTPLHDQYKVEVVENVPIGIPTPKFPDLSLSYAYIIDGVIIIIVSYAQTLAMARAMGLKNNYPVDPGQEMLSCGMCSLVCGVFSGYISGASVSRSFVQDGAGGRTQVASLVAAALVFLVIMAMAPYFYYLPMCVLAAIIVVNLQTVFLKLCDIPTEWKRSNYDCTVWVFTCFSCIILNADLGLLAGVLFSSCLVLIRLTSSPVTEVGLVQASLTSVQLRSIKSYFLAKQLPSIQILTIRTPLFFLNSETFIQEVFSKVNYNPLKQNKYVQEHCLKNPSSEKCTVIKDEVLSISSINSVKVVVLCASGVSFIDVMGIQALGFVIKHLKSVGITVLITNVPENLLPLLKSNGFLATFEDCLLLNLPASLPFLVQFLSDMAM